jgi:prepilin-type N-terminal cleavage/methylation domain-containing protein
MTSKSRSHGFTLLEVLAVVLLTGIVISVAINFYLNLSNSSLAAMDGAQRARRAALVLDRVARDLEATVLLKKPDNVDPLAHPWLFLAEGDESDLGAQRLKFVSRGRRPRSSSAPESDLEMVAWIAMPGANRDLELRRWSSPALPPGLDRSFPTADGADLVAAGIADFGVRLEDDKGEWVAHWDSSTVSASSQLPVAAEISVSFFKRPDSDERDGPYARRILLPLRPLDLAKQVTGSGATDPNAPDQDKDQTGDSSKQANKDKPQNCVTVGECLARHPEINSLLPEDLRAVAAGSGGQCANIFAGTGFVPADCLQ